jgi:hypothetical protein
MRKSVSRCCVAITLLIICSHAFAKDKKSPVPPAPLPKQIISSKTVFIAKGPGSDPYLKGGAELAFDTFYADVKEWGKYRIVSSPEEADLVLELSYSSQQVGTHVWSATNTYTGSTQVYSSPNMDPRVSLNVYDRKTGFVLWSAAEARDAARRQKNREKNLVNAVHEMVTNLRSRVESSVSD